MVDETGVRVADHFYETLEQVVTDVTEESIYAPLEANGAPRELAEAMEARLRQVISARLAVRFMSGMHGWGEVLDQKNPTKEGK